jgi:hypothetical protein
MKTCIQADLIAAQGSPEKLTALAGSELVVPAGLTGLDLRSLRSLPAGFAGFPAGLTWLYLDGRYYGSRSQIAALARKEKLK